MLDDEMLAARLLREKSMCTTSQGAPCLCYDSVVVSHLRTRLKLSEKPTVARPKAGQP